MTGVIPAAEDGSVLLAALAAEPGFARLAEPTTPAIFWRAEREAPVWSSDGGRSLIARLPREADGAPALPAATALRLRQLAEGLAPRKGFRLERLRWRAMEPPLVFACRLVPSASGDLLLTALLPPDAATIRRPNAPETVVTSSGSGAAAKGRRFMWRTDGEGRFTFVSPELAEAVGARGADILGLRWADLVGRLVEDPQGAVAAAFAAGESWTRRRIGWRDPAQERLIPVEFSATLGPFENGRPTHRGFGIAHSDLSRAVVPGAFGDPPARIVDAAAPAAEGSEGLFALLRARLVVSGSQQAAPAGELTSTERGAFSEIARTLRSVPEEVGDEPERPSAEIVPLPRPRLRAEPTALLDELPLGIVVLRDGAPLFANRALLSRLGDADLPQAVARGALQILAKVAPEDAAPGTVTLIGLDGLAHSFEGRAARVDWGDLGADLVLLSPPGAAPAAVVEALRLDLDARERRLEEARAALDLAADGVVTLDASARLMSLTRSAERLFGIAANEVVGDGITALIDPRDHRAVLSCLDALRLGPSSGVQHCEVRGRARSGAAIPLSMRAGRAPGEDGGFSVAFSDISHFRLLEDDLREARETAEEASANRADFLARISHEVRTPLTAITGFAELMLEERFGPLGNERYRGYIRDIRDSGIHVISLVNDLLDLAKATSGAQDLNPSPLDLNAVVQQCVALATPLAGKEKTIIRTSFPPTLPRVVADERSIRQIVINLLSNAIRFTGAGGQVIVSTASGGRGEVVLSVRDTGPGMSEEEVATALTPFRQVSATRRADGTGLGLPLSKALTEANGGVFVVTSARDHGTLVEVRLPVERQNQVAAE